VKPGASAFTVMLSPPGSRASARHRDHRAFRLTTAGFDCLETPAGREIAAAELAATHDILMLHVIRGAVRRRRAAGARHAWLDDMLASGRFFEKKLRKKLLTLRRLSGHSMAAQRPSLVKVFCGAFFQKSDRLLVAATTPAWRWLGVPMAVTIRTMTRLISRSA